jgi:hypothetical protein
MWVSVKVLAMVMVMVTVLQAASTQAPLWVQRASD